MIYVASSWRNGYQPLVVKYLRSKGFKVYDFKNPREGGNGFHWSEIDENWKSWSTAQFAEALKHPIAEKGFYSDFDAMTESDVCILVLPCGRSAHLEAGWFVGHLMPVFVYQPHEMEPELMYKMVDLITDDMDVIVECLQARKVGK